MTRSHDSGAHLAELMQLDKSTLPADGGERFNRLIFAASPYLLQHAENPVDWYEWGQPAFERATRENLPILLSIGYATCHWCHVMAHESFGDQEVADLLNRNFVCIKVDREERPDIDDFYMTVSQMLTGSGGWPLNIFMTPDKRPFFAMTYLPKRGRSGMSGFMDLLGNIASLWRQQPDRIDKNCDAILEALSQLKREPTGGGGVELSELAGAAFAELDRIYDREYGGFGSAPKFPMPINLSWLLQQGEKGNQEALAMALHALRNLRLGGIWDQVGGGLHRYSVDREWLVPHFEKMLYDQALLSQTALEAFQASGDEQFLEMADNIFGFVLRELASPEGGFYSALDADTEGVEGKFYVWDKSEVDLVLGADAELFCSYYDITPQGNFEGHSIPNASSDLEEFCRQEGLNPAATAATLEKCRAALLERRSRRVRPLRDEKIITAWNGLMIASLAKGGILAGRQEWIDSAAQAARFLLDKLRRPDGRLLRSYLKDGQIPAFLEDYAFLCHGLIELWEATLDAVWRDAALDLAQAMTGLFYDRQRQQFTKTGQDAEQMPVRASLDYDGVMPSPFSLAARCLIRLGHQADRPELLDLAHVLLAAPLAEAQRHPTTHLGSLLAAAMLESEPVVITLRGNRDSAQLKALLQSAKSRLLYDMVLRHEPGDAPAQALVCAAGACRPAVSTPQELTRPLALVD